MCCPGNEPEVKMVTGKRAFQFSCLVLLEAWQEIKREWTRVDHVMNKMVEFQELRDEVRALVVSNQHLYDKVCHLERRER